MSLGIYYVIKHKATGELMPLFERNRGYSWWNPSNNKLDPKKIIGVPRLLKSRKQANQVINQWNAMPCAEYRGYTTYSGEYDYDIQINSDGRKKDDLEVVEVIISEVK
ncbi:MAG: hypothetical protein ACRD8Z_17290 [Nitrososphaeraceae archaeon]